MGLSKDLIQQFVDVTNDIQDRNSETFVLATAVVSDGKTYVKIDGSEILTPVKSTTKLNEGDRVTVMIKNHTATVTGNITSPAVDSGEVEKKIDEFGTIIADNIEAQNAKIDNIVAENVEIKETLTATNAKIETIEAENVEINGKLEANEAEIAKLKVGKLDADTAEITYATIESLKATNIEVSNIKGEFADFSQLTAEDLKALNASIKNLETEKLNVKDAEIKFANIDFSNIGMAAIEELFAQSGIIKDLVTESGTITGELVGVTIKGDLIEAETLVADKLVVKGQDGLYYKLNVSGNTVESEQTEYNSLNGSIITAKSITATKISVSDLVAFDATIGGFKITDTSIYSGVKESATNGTRGIYLDSTGQLSVGDANSFIKFFKDTDGKWKLAISANTIKLSASNSDLESTIDDIKNKVQNTTKSIEEQFAASDNPTTVPTTGWSTTPPVWQNGKYIWSKTVTTYTDGRTVESKPVCITGAKGENGSSGSSGKGIKSITNYYLATNVNTGVTDATSGWTETVQTITASNKYLWNYEKVTYTDNSSTKTIPVIIGAYGDKGQTGSSGSNGQDGVGIKSIAEKYAVSSSNTTAPSTWHDTVQTMTATNKYLWNYEIITYTNGGTSETSKRVIGVYGDKGATGATGPAGAAGVGIKSVDVEYYLSTSSTSQAGGSWSTTAPTWVDGKYIWTRTKTVTTDNKTTTTSPVCITGGKGSTGSVGQGVESITEEYYLSTSKTTQTGGSWVTTPPTWSMGKYMWTRSKIVYKNPTSTAYTKPVCDSSWEAVNEIEVGGNNLYLDTKDFASSPSVWKNYTGWEKLATKYKNFTVMKRSNAWVGLHQPIEMKAGELYTLSFYGKVETGGTIVLVPRTSVKDYADYQGLTILGGNFVSTISWVTTTTDGTQWNRYYVTVKATEDCTVLLRPENGISGKAFSVCGFKLEIGNKLTDWTPSPEDLEKRIASAEQKIEPGKITATVEDQINKNGSTVLATKSYVTQESDKVLYKFSSSGGTNLIKGSKVGETSNAYGFAIRSVDMGILRKGKTYTLTINGRTVNGTGGRYLTVFIFNGDWTFSKSMTIKETVDTTRSITFTVPSNLTGNLMVSSYHYPEAGDRSGSSRINWYCLTEGEVSSLWIPHHGELIDGSTQIDGNGVTILNGAITIKNKAGQTVLKGDVDGNLSLTGSLVVSSNKNQILRVDTADTKFPHMVIDAYGPYMDKLSVCSDYVGYAAQKAVDGVFIRNNRMEIYGTGETFWVQGNARVGGTLTVGSTIDTSGQVHGEAFNMGSLTDLTLGSPWYGLGRSTNTSGGGRMVQLSGYFGLLFKTMDTTISIPSSGGIGITGPDIISINNNNNWKGLDLYRYHCRARYGIGSDGTGGSQNFPAIECWNSGAGAYASRLEVKSDVLQYYSAGGGTFKCWSDTGGHGGISIGNTGSGYLKWLRGHTDLQCRNYADNAYTRINASVFVVNSQEKAKENIVDLDSKKAINILMTNEIKEYNLINERNELEQVDEEATELGYVLDLEMIEPDNHCGLILDHLTEEATDILQPGRTEGIDVYAMASLLWKVCQEQQNNMLEFEERIKTLEDLVLSRL